MASLVPQQMLEAAISGAVPGCFPAQIPTAWQEQVVCQVRQQSRFPSVTSSHVPADEVTEVSPAQGIGYKWLNQTPLHPGSLAAAWQDLTPLQVSRKGAKGLQINVEWRNRWREHGGTLREAGWGREFHYRVCSRV